MSPSSCYSHGMVSSAFRARDIGRALGFLAFALPQSALAEVSDKAASISDHWTTSLPIAAVALLLGGWRWWLAIPVAGLLVVNTWRDVTMAMDPYVGAALWQEQGLNYFISLWASDLVLAASLVAGFYWGWLKRDERRRTAQRSAVTPYT